MRILNEEEEEEDQPSDNSEKEQSGHTAVIQKKFLKERKIFLWGGIDDKSAKDITEKLLYLELSDPGKPIDFFMNTPGGSITPGCRYMTQ
jgi:ATP-dependent Clp protease protease subunit